MFEKLNKKLEKIPTGWLNFLTIISSAVTIITPIVGLFTIKKMYPDKHNIFIIYFVTICVLVFMLLIMSRYMLKYRKILVEVKSTTSEKFFDTNRQFRNNYFDIDKIEKEGKLSVEYLTAKVEGMLKDSLDDICEIYKAFSGQKVSACIKYIDSVGSVELDAATLRTFVRSTNADVKRCERDNNLTRSIYIKDNSDFYEILNPNNKQFYFYQQNLIEYAKNCEKMGSEYKNSTHEWELYYKGTIVVPISIANKRVAFSGKEHCYNVLGFLCIDSLSTEAFLKSEETYNVNIAQAVAAQMYIMLNQYQQYLKKLTDGCE